MKSQCGYQWSYRVRTLGSSQRNSNDDRVNNNSQLQHLQQIQNPQPQTIIKARNLKWNDNSKWNLWNKKTFYEAFNSEFSWYQEVMNTCDMTWWRRDWDEWSSYWTEPCEWPWVACVWRCMCPRSCSTSPLSFCISFDWCSWK